MKLALFLGSGVSFESGLPRIEEITDSILYDEWHNYTHSIFSQGPPSGGLKLTNFVPWIQEFIKVIKAYSDSYLNSISGRSTNYEDLFFLLQQLYDEGVETENAAISDFYKFMRHETAKIAVQKPTDHHQIKVRVLAGRSCDFIQNVVQHKLWFEDNPICLDLILNLANEAIMGKLEELLIFTLNHDLLIETALKQNNIQYVDGFGEPDGNGKRFYNQEIFNEKMPVKLVKLHGSINWYRHRQYANEEWKEDLIETPLDAEYQDTYFCKPIGTNIDYVIDEPLVSVPVFITGMDNKMLSYTYGIIADMYYVFLDSMRSIDYLIMSGYGWNDRGINARLRDWLNSSSHKKLILLHERPNKIRDDSKMGWHYFDRWKRLSKLITVPKYLKDTALIDIKQYLR